MALVMAVSAIDSYMHALILRRVAAVRKSADLSKALARLEIPFSEFAGLADSSILAQREKRSTRPWVQVKVALQTRLLKHTFQSFDQVGTALSISGVDDGWLKVSNELGQKVPDIKRWLDNLVLRQNQIAHEGDLKLASRPRRLQFNDVSQTDARQQVDRVESLIDSIEEVVARET
jgi:hypothetical protein